MASKQAQPQAQAATTGFRLPAPYRAFFLFVEPLSALAGAYLAHYDQRAYLSLADAAAATALPPAVPRATAIVLSQLANLYLLFALNEALVLRATADVRVWKTLLFVLLVADFGHLYSLRPLGLGVYWRAGQWNAMDWATVPFVYLGASMRISFLADVGLGNKPRKLVKKAKD